MTAPTGGFAHHKMVAAGGNGGERHNRRRRRQGLPEVWVSAAELGIDRWHSRHGRHQESAEEDQRCGLTGTDDVYERPKREAAQHGMAGDANDAFRCPQPRGSRLHGGWVRGHHGADEEQEGRQHRRDEDPTQPEWGGPKRLGRRGAERPNEKPEGGERQNGKHGAECVFAKWSGQNRAQPGAGDADMHS